MSASNIDIESIEKCNWQYALNDDTVTKYAIGGNEDKSSKFEWFYGDVVVYPVGVDPNATYDDTTKILDLTFLTQASPRSHVLPYGFLENYWIFGAQYKRRIFKQIQFTKAGGYMKCDVVFDGYKIKVDL